MFSRALIAAGALMVLAVPASAGPINIGVLQACAGSAVATQCAFQVVKGNNNLAITQQYTSRTGHKHTTQFAATLQEGNKDRAYTRQVGLNQVALTVQSGNSDSAFTYQNGANQASITAQSGNGQWAATSSIGGSTVTTVVLNSY